MEKELLLRVSEGDEAAFTLLFNAFHQRLGAYVFRLTESPTLTQEIVQDVFVRIWLKRAFMSGVGNFNAYLFTAARNHTFNCLKKIARQRSGQARLEDSLQAISRQTVPDGAPGEADPAEGYRDLLDRAIERLPGQQQKVYVLHRRQGLSHAEIAHRLNLSVETVKKHMSLALKSIRNDLFLSDRQADMLILILTTSLVLGS